MLVIIIYLYAVDPPVVVELTTWACLVFGCKHTFGLKVRFPKRNYSYFEFKRNFVIFQLNMNMYLMHRFMN